MNGSTRPYHGRFAPSPTGELHFGSLLVAVGSWLRARSAGGTWTLRIEDLDRSRTIPGASMRIAETLAAHGLTSDRPILKQAADTSRFSVALDRLIDVGAAYACTCTRADVVAGGGVHRACTAAVPVTPAGQTTWRFRVQPGEVSFIDRVRGRQSQDVASRVGDFVLRRANGEYTYHLAVAVDDSAQGITEVVRGADLLASTARQIALQEALGLSTPGYLHLPMIVDEVGAKLSKQARSAPVDPSSPMPTLRAALRLLGQPVDQAARQPDALLHAAASRFDLAALPRAHSLQLPRY